MKVLITGGTGLIAQAFIKRFIKELKFTVLTRSPKAAKKKLPTSVDLIDSLDKLNNLNDFDAVINLAGEPIIDKRWHEQQKQLICQSRWQTTQDLVDLFSKSQTPPNVFLSGSAIGIYGNRLDEELIENSTLEQNDFPTQVCLQWEEIAQQAKTYTRVVTLRTGIVLSTNGGALAKMIQPFKLGLGGRIGDGQQYMSWIHYQDHINAMFHILTTSSICGPVNIVSPQAERNQNFTKALAKKLHRPATFPMPKFVLKCLFGESSCLLLDSQKVQPKILLNSGFEFEYTNLSSALDDLI